MDKVLLLKKKWVKFDQSLWGFFLYHQSRIFVVTIHWIQTFKKTGSLWIMNHVPVFQCANPHILLVILDPKFAHPTLGHPMVVVSWHPWAIHSRSSPNMWHSQSSFNRPQQLIPFHLGVFLNRVHHMGVSENREHP